MSVTKIPWEELREMETVVPQGNLKIADGREISITEWTIHRSVSDAVRVTVKGFLEVERPKLSERSVLLPIRCPCGYAPRAEELEPLVGAALVHCPNCDREWLLPPHKNSKSPQAFIPGPPEGWQPRVGEEVRILTVPGVPRYRGGRGRIKSYREREGDLPAGWTVEEADEKGQMIVGDDAQAWYLDLKDMRPLEKPEKEESDGSEQGKAGEGL